ncbi:MAG: ferredoxin [Rhodospirillales bacterium]
MTPGALESAVTDAGFYIGGTFTLTPEEAALFSTPGPDALLIGNTGPDMWRRFRQEQGDDGLPDPLNRWTRQRLDRIAGQADALVIYPFDGPPWPPFGQWALRTGQYFESPTGLKIHPRLGLWQAFRAVLVLPEGWPVTMLATETPGRSPCDSCRDRPCLTTCPVGAFSPAGYDVAACRHHVGGPGTDCLNRGCLARHACPVAPDRAYAPDQAAFHMQSFLTP